MLEQELKWLKIGEASKFGHVHEERIIWTCPCGFIFATRTADYNPKPKRFECNSCHAIFDSMSDDAGIYSVSPETTTIRHMAVCPNCFGRGWEVDEDD